MRWISCCKGTDRPTAVICHNDLMALGVMHALRSRGLVPGRDLGVVGFDDIPEATNAVPTAHDRGDGSGGRRTGGRQAAPAADRIPDRTSRADL